MLTHHSGQMEQPCPHGAAVWQFPHGRNHPVWLGGQDKEGTLWDSWVTGEVCGQTKGSQAVGKLSSALTGTMAGAGNHWMGAKASDSSCLFGKHALSIFLYQALRGTGTR